MKHPSPISRQEDPSTVLRSSTAKRQVRAAAENTSCTADPKPCSRLNHFGSPAISCRTVDDRYGSPLNSFSTLSYKARA